MATPAQKPHVVYVLAGTKENSRRSAVRPGLILGNHPYGPEQRLPDAVLVLAATDSNDKRLGMVGHELVEDLRPALGDRARFVKLEGRWNPWHYDQAYAFISRAVSAALEEVAKDFDPHAAEHIVCISTGTAPQWLALRDFLVGRGLDTLQAVVQPEGAAVSIQRIYEGTAIARPAGVVAPAVDAVSRLAKLPSTGVVLLEGPTGSGKTTLARLLHKAWEVEQKRKGHFVAMNVASIPDELFDGELRGWEAGAHSTAKALRRGLLEQAHGGTLLLDEIGDLSLQNQVKLLQVLDSLRPGERERTVRRLGGEREQPVDAHVVVATNRSLHDEVRAGRFRADLHARVRGHTVRLPHLSERRADIMRLYEEHIQQAQNFVTGVESVVRLSDPARGELEAFALGKGSTWVNSHRDVVQSAERLVLAARNAAVDTRLAYIRPDQVRAEVAYLREYWAEMAPIGPGPGSRPPEDLQLREALVPGEYEKRSKIERYRASLLLQAWNSGGSKARAWEWLMRTRALPRPSKRSPDAKENPSSRFSKEMAGFRWREGVFDVGEPG